MSHNIFDALQDDASRAAGERVASLVAGYLSAAHAGLGSVSTAQSAAELARRFEGPVPLTGSPFDEVLARVQSSIAADANRLAHPMAMGHQVSAPLPAAVWADAIISAMNQSLAVSEMSPAATAVERGLVRWMANLAGLGERAGGTFTSGGTEATFTALAAARAAILPDAWEDGVSGGPAPVVVCGEHAHYSVARAVGALGLGTRNLVTVPSRGWRMDVDRLEDTLDRLRRDGRRIAAVVATAGSTPTGSFDDLEPIGQICDRDGVWLHVDGAHGASALLSSTHRGRLRGIERARTIAWDPHKMMLMPLAAGALLARDERDLDAAFSQRAPYLFHGAHDGRTVDQGVRSFQCSRRADAVKLWIALQRYGVEGMGALYDRLCATARALWEAASSRSDFVALHEPECNIVCFRWIGEGSHDAAVLDSVNLAARDAYNRSGHGWITTTVLGGRRVLRVTVMNPRTSGEHVTRMLDEVAATAARLVR